MSSHPPPINPGGLLSFSSRGDIQTVYDQPPAVQRPSTLVAGGRRYLVVIVAIQETTVVTGEPGPGGGSIFVTTREVPYRLYLNSYSADQIQALASGEIYVEVLSRVDPRITIQVFSPDLRPDFSARGPVKIEKTAYSFGSESVARIGAQRPRLSPTDKLEVPYLPTELSEENYQDFVQQVNTAMQHLQKVDPTDN